MDFAQGSAARLAIVPLAKAAQKAFSLNLAVDSASRAFSAAGAALRASTIPAARVSKASTGNPPSTVLPASVFLVTPAARPAQDHKKISASSSCQRNTGLISVLRST